MLEEEYPSELWARVYTDGSATNATTKGGAGIYIEYPNGVQQSLAIPTGLYCSNYKAEEEALSVIQALSNNKLPQLEIAIHSIKSLKTVIQWIPSHCGINGNEKADKLAKEGAQQQQVVNSVCSQR